jgi:proteic killer suppression protein
MQFKDEDLKAFWDDPDNNPPKRVPPEVRKALYRKLQMLDAAHDLKDLRIPPSNHLEKLQGKRSGLYSIRVNIQWRLCFIWQAGEVKGVEFDDYH